MTIALCMSQSILLELSTSNLSKAHVTRDSSGPATLAISVSLQQ